MIHGQAVIDVFIYCLRILHIYAAKGMRAFTLAAAERMKELRRLDAKEHRGKVMLSTSCKQQHWAAWLRAADAVKIPFSLPVTAGVALSSCYALLWHSESAALDLPSELGQESSAGAGSAPHSRCHGL